MRIFKIYVVLFIISLLNGKSVFAQTNPDVVDFLVMPVYKENSDSTVRDIVIQYKITDINKTEKVYLSFGTSKDKDDVRSVIFDKAKTGDQYFLKNGNTEVKLRVNIEASHVLIFSKNDWERIKDISIYIIDKNNKASKRKNYFNENVWSRMPDRSKRPIIDEHNKAPNGKNFKK
jgi:hypothetical protein